MKKLSLLLLCLYFSDISAQTSELLYAPADMQQLKIMADSLGLQFKQCKSPFSFSAWHQAPALRIEIRTEGSLDTLIADLKINTDLKTLRARYGHLMVGNPSAALVVYNKNEFLAGNASELNRPYADKETMATWPLLQRGGWVYSESSRYSKNGVLNVIEAWQLQEAFQAPAIAATYGRLIAYVDCLVDNNTTLKLPRNRTVRLGESYNMLQKYMFRKTIRKSLIMEEITDDDLGNYACAHYKDDETVRRLTEEIMLDDMEGSGIRNFASMVEEVVPKERKLELKRSAEVIGFCSMDDGPRMHTWSIAVLASQTHQWPVFIKAHLNIMNDYVERRSDGSYAQQRRKTYLKELDD